MGVFDHDIASWTHQWRIQPQLVQNVVHLMIGVERNENRLSFHDSLDPLYYPRICSTAMEESDILFPQGVCVNSLRLVQDINRQHT